MQLSLFRAEPLRDWKGVELEVRTADGGEAVGRLLGVGQMEEALRRWEGWPLSKGESSHRKKARPLLPPPEVTAPIRRLEIKFP